MSATAGEEVRQQIADLVRRGAFKPIAKYLPADQSEERLAEATALTLAMALRYAARGTRLPDAILVHHARLRAVEFKRHLVGSKGRGLDALNQRNYLRGEVEILHLDGIVAADGGDDTATEGDQQLVGLAVRRNGDPSEHLASAFDLQTWLETLPERDRRLLQLRAEGRTLEETAAALGTSVSTVFARCQHLGAQLADVAGVPVSKRAYRRHAAPRSNA